MNENLPDNPQIQVLKSGKTGLFTNYIYKAIPLAFDESMSYYETLCGLLNYLKNVVIPTVNNNADAVAELQSLYEQLRNYVDNYFTNLDVQEEINNKLDEMVEDGTLPEIVASYLNSKAIFGFNNVASMKQSTNLINGSYARTLGYYTKNDGGSALYKIRTITNDDVVDESFIIELQDDSLIAEIVINDEINLNALGISTIKEDNSSIINNAIVYANDNNINKIKINRIERYYIKNPIIIYDDIFFDGGGATIEKTDNSTYNNINSILYLVKKPIYQSHNFCDNIIIKSINLDGGINKIPTYGIYMENSARRIHIEDINVYQCINGIKTNNIWTSVFKRIYITGCREISFDVGTNGTSLEINDVHCGSSKIGIKMVGIVYSTLIATSCDGITETGYMFQGSSVNITSMGCESPNAINAIYATNSYININNGYIYSNTTNSAAEMIHSAGSRLVLTTVTFGGNSNNDIPGKFINFGSNSHISLNSCIYPTGKFLTENNGNASDSIYIVDNYNAGSYSNNKFSIVPRENSDYMKPIQNPNPTGEKVKTGNIWFNNYNSPMIGVTNESSGYQFRGQVGDLFINQGNNKSGIAMFQQTTLESQIEIINPITNIENNILSFTSIEYNLEAVLCGFSLKVGDTITNNDGATATISTIDSTSIEISNVTGTFNIGDTIYGSKKTYMRDVRYKGIQQVLSGNSTSRPDGNATSWSTGLMYFDTTLNKPIWWNGSRWVDSTGSNV